MLKLKLATLIHDHPHLREFLTPLVFKEASFHRVAVKDPSKLRYQAVFLMGTPGSGKSYVVENKYLKHMPGGGSDLVQDGKLNREEMSRLFQRDLSTKERSLSNISFEKAVKIMKERGIEIELVDVDSAKIPFVIGHPKENRNLDRSEWKEHFSKGELKILEMLEHLVFSSPKKELPSYWRQVNPDVYKEEISGHDNKRPSMVHNMSSNMSKTYMEAVFETGDPVVIDGTGKSFSSMEEKIDAAKDAGYRVSLVYISVPLTVALIRNSLRDRVVRPLDVEEMSRSIPKNFNRLKPFVDKAKVVINRNDNHDARSYAQNREKINEILIKDTGKNLVDFILEVAPHEIGVLKALKIV